MYMGVATFGPATALESVTGVTYWIHIVIIITICTLYTAIVSEPFRSPWTAFTNWASESSCLLSGYELEIISSSKYEKYFMTSAKTGSRRWCIVCADAALSLTYMYVYTVSRMCSYRLNKHVDNFTKVY